MREHPASDDGAKLFGLIAENTVTGARHDGKRSGLLRDLLAAALSLDATGTRRWQCAASVNR
jgi:hypothetical protein